VNWSTWSEQHRDQWPSSLNRYAIAVSSLAAKYREGILIGLGLFSLGHGERPKEASDDQRLDVVSLFAIVVGPFLLAIGLLGVIRS
jgi:hypothetical protein